MSELQLSTDTLTARKNELVVHLIEGESYLSEERKTAIKREIARITFELQQRSEDV